MKPFPMNRREFLRSGVAATATLATTAAVATSATKSTAAPAPAAATAPRRIDTNVTLFQWPGRRLPHDDPASLLKVLDQHGITEAWAGSFEGILHRDLAGVN